MSGIVTGALSTGAQIGTTLASYWLNKRQQDQQNKYAAEQEAKARAYNSPAAQMARLQAAGVSAYAAQNAIVGVAPAQGTAAPAADYQPTDFTPAVDSGFGQGLSARMQDIQNDQNLRDSRMKQQQLSLNAKELANRIRMDNQVYDFNEKMNDLKIINQRLINGLGQTDLAFKVLGLNMFIHSNGFNEDGSMSPEQIKLYRDKWKADMQQQINSSNYEASVKSKMLKDVDTWYTLSMNKEYAEIGLALAQGDEAAYNAALKKLTKEQIDNLPDNLKNWALCGEHIGYILDYESGNEETIEAYEEKKATDQGQDYTAVVEGEFAAAFSSANFKVKAGMVLRGEQAKTYNRFVRQKRKEREKQAAAAQKKKQAPPKKTTKKGYVSKVGTKLGKYYQKKYRK